MENAIYDVLGRYIAPPQPTPDPWVRPAGIWDSNAPNLRVICSECKTVMREGSEPTSHGSCDACSAVFLAELDAMTRVA